MGALRFAERARPENAVPPCLHVPLRRLDGGDPETEIWRGKEPATAGQHGDIRYRHDDEILFGVIVLPETALLNEAGKTPLQQATESAYRQVFSLLESLRFPSVFRFWNFIPAINAHSFGIERYRQFNIGRQEAYQAHGCDVQANLPAACALGLAQGRLSIAFLAGRTAAQSIENPRQISAFQYPAQYGPCSPTFSRASLARVGSDEVLFISGTASIVGHVSVHPGDVVAQTRETVSNIEAVLAEANRLSRGDFNLSDLHYRVYVRHPADWRLIQDELARCVGCAPKAVFLQADICRLELLLEIEATAGVRSGGCD